MQVQVLHVVQEALSNARKHAQASEVFLEVSKGDAWSLQVRDNGRGFVPDQEPGDRSHVGMQIMRERASRVGATVQIESAPGQGTTVRLTLPARPVSG